MTQAEPFHALQAILDGELPDKEMKNSYTRETKLKSTQQSSHNHSVFMYKLKDLATVGDSYLAQHSRTDTQHLHQIDFT